MNAEKLFGTRNLYGILQLDKETAEIQDGEYMLSRNHQVFSLIFTFTPNSLLPLSLLKSIAVKKSYYRLARLYHPDRTPSHQIEEAKAKFNIIHNAYAILTDAEKKKQYDNGTDILFTKPTMAARWENFMKPVDSNAIEKAKNRYQNSNAEKKDISREFVIGKGSLTHVLNNIPFMRVEDENRVIEIVKNLIDDGKIPKMQIKRIKK